jgi:hypothetical protein
MGRGKRFFFEKKKQKTFVVLSCATSASCSKYQKFFGSFFQKRTLSWHLPVAPDNGLVGMINPRRGQ